jgi:hypothetical protein
VANFLRRKESWKSSEPQLQPKFCSGRRLGPWSNARARVRARQQLPPRCCVARPPARRRSFGGIGVDAGRQHGSDGQEGRDRGEQGAGQSQGPQGRQVCCRLGSDTAQEVAAPAARFRQGGAGVNRSRVSVDTAAPVAGSRSASPAPQKKYQPACKPGSVWRLPSATAIRLGRPSLGASSNQPERLAWKRAWRRAVASTRPATPIWSCSRWGLPCRDCCQPRGALLPHPFTLTSGEPQAVCFLWHFPWGRPRRPLAATLLPWSPDFPPPELDRHKARHPAAAVRPAGWSEIWAIHGLVKPCTCTAAEVASAEQRLPAGV